LGLLAVRRELLESWMPYKLRPAPDGVPDRWETGTQNHEGLAGMTAAVEYLADVGRTYGTPDCDTRRAAVVAAYEAIGDHERGLARRFLDGLSGLPHVRLWGIGDVERLHERTPTFAVRISDQDPAKTAAELARRGIYVWDGHYYAITVMERLGLLESGGAVRIGFCHYHDDGDVDRVLAALADLP
jgi:selenocysteine lyase/cysteine desulfurase